MNPRLRTILIFAGAGAVVGALYGVLYVWYREQQGREPPEGGTEVIPPMVPNGALISPEVSDPERTRARARTQSARDRTPPSERQALMKRAKELRESEGLGPADAMRRAAEENQEA